MDTDGIQDDWFSSVYFQNPNVGYITGGYSDPYGWSVGDIWKTNDGGNNWIRLYGGEAYFMDMVFLSENLSFVVGQGGVILKREGISSVKQDEIFITNFKLSQNYPNPFNPTTSIIYQIPKVSFVTIKVYDILGNGIATLVNEEKPAGSYEVEFDGTVLPSGIYFYQLRAGNFIETKKMVILK
ncbi:MAG: T9SS type A sorting domain-containing protein, partial [Ignavibacteriaceae bacterium]